LRQLVAINYFLSHSANFVVLKIVIKYFGEAVLRPVDCRYAWRQRPPSAPSFTPLGARTSGGDDDGVDAWLEPVHHLVEFLLQQQRLDAQPITEHNAVSPHQQLATVMVAKTASLRAAHM